MVFVTDIFCRFEEDGSRWKSSLSWLSETKQIEEYLKNESFMQGHAFAPFVKTRWRQLKRIQIEFQSFLFLSLFFPCLPASIFFLLFVRFFSRSTPADLPIIMAFFNFTQYFSPRINKTTVFLSFWHFVISSVCLFTTRIKKKFPVLNYGFDQFCKWENFIRLGDTLSWS